ncbi:MAG TPA: YfhO family protein [Verrucomicrobiae bacterium]|nr:YfhO family protein [Verrucomicrobiae bacterium]
MTENRADPFFTPPRFCLLLALLVFAAFPQVILGMQTFVARDFGFFVYPLAHFQRDCFWHGEIPLWNPYNECGVPFLAQWNTMPLYPPSLIYLTLPMPWSLNFFDLLHLWFAGVGMYFLARRWTGNDFAAAFAGVVFSFNGMTLNLLMWPSHLATLAWMPWVVLAVEKSWRESGRSIFIAALAGAMQMLAGGPEIILMTWLLLSALWLRQIFRNDFPRVNFWRFPALVALVSALAAAQLFPFLDLAAHSQRDAGYADLRWSMPGWGWANLLVPVVFGYTKTENIFFQYDQYWTSSYYLGIAGIWLALLSIFSIKKNPAGPDSIASRSKIILLIAIAFIAFIFALGGNTPILPAIRKILPQLSKITYPVKYFLLVTFIVPLLAAFALRELEKLRRQMLVIGAMLLALIAVILVWAAKWPFSTDSVHATLLNGISRAGFLILTGAILFVTGKNGLKISRFAPLLLILVVWADVWTHEPPQNPTVPPNIYEQNLAREDLKMQPQPELGQSRAMISQQAYLDFIHMALSDPKNNFLAKRRGYCANANLLDDVPKVDGFFSIMPREIYEVLGLIYDHTNNFSPLENFLGVSQITAPDAIFRWQARTNYLPLVTAGQKAVFFNDDETLGMLADSHFDGRKIVCLPPDEKSLVAITNQTDVKIKKFRFENALVQIEAEAAAPSLVVVSQTYYHNWRALVDGKPSLLLRANGAFQAVEIPAGDHRIKLIYQDRAFEIGATISLATLVIAVFFIFWRKRAN